MTEYPKLDKLQLSHSTRKQFHSCPRKFEYARIWQPERERSGFAADVGTALHCAYQEFLLSGDLDKATMELMLNYPLDSDDKYAHLRSLEACYSTLLMLCNSRIKDEYDLAQVKCLDGVTRPAIEVPFQINLVDTFLDEARTIPITYVGKIDAILIKRSTGHPRVTDIKTNRDTSGMTSVKYTFDEQCLPYGVVLEAALGGEVNTFDVTYLSAFIDLLEPNVQPFTYVKSKQEVRDWARGMAVDIQLMKLYYSMQWFARESDACLAYKRTCPFFDYCNTRDVEATKKLMDFENKVATRKPKEPFVPWITLDLTLEN